jgi:ABC-type branched-subunit amino acid transport system permease subunit
VVQTYEADVYGLAIVLIVLFAPGGIGSLFKRRTRAGERS